jgi:hypothetical protein
VDGDGFLNPLDVLVIINFLNRNAARGLDAEGEAYSVESNQSATSSPQPQSQNETNTWLAAFQQLEEEKLVAKRKRF